MKKIFGFLFWYLILPAAAAFGLKVVLTKKKSCTLQEMPHLCIRPTRWQVTLEK